jgi:hypothetical protein
MNDWLMKVTFGTPERWSVMESWTLHDEQDPQWPKALMTTSADLPISFSASGG